MAPDAPAPLSPLPSPPSSDGLPSPLTSNSDSIGPPLSDLQSLSDWNPSDHSDIESDAADDVESDYDMLASWRGSRSASSSIGNLRAPPSDNGSTGTDRSAAVEALRLSYPDPMASMSDESTATLLASTASFAGDGSYSLIDGPETTSEPPPVQPPRLAFVEGTDRSENVKTWLHSTGSSSKIEGISRLDGGKLETSKIIPTPLEVPPPPMKDLFEELNSATTESDCPATPASDEKNAFSGAGDSFKIKLEELCGNRTQRPRVVSTLGLVLAGAIVIASTLYARNGPPPMPTAPSTSTSLPERIPLPSVVAVASSTSVTSAVPSATPVSACSMSNPAACALALVDVRTSIATLTNPFNGKAQIPVQQANKSVDDSARLPPLKRSGKRHAKLTKRSKRCGTKRRTTKEGKQPKLTSELKRQASERAVQDIIARLAKASTKASHRAQGRLRTAVSRAHFLRQFSESHLRQIQQQSKLTLRHWREASKAPYHQLRKQSQIRLRQLRQEAQHHALLLSGEARRTFRDLAKRGPPATAAFVDKNIWHPWRRHTLRAAHNLGRMRRSEYRLVGKRISSVSCEDVKSKYQGRCRKAEKARKTWAAHSRQPW